MRLWSCCSRSDWLLYWVAIEWILSYPVYHFGCWSIISSCYTIILWATCHISGIIRHLLFLLLILAYSKNHKIDNDSNSNITIDITHQVRRSLVFIMIMIIIIIDDDDWIAIEHACYDCVASCKLCNRIPIWWAHWRIICNAMEDGWAGPSWAGGRMSKQYVHYGYYILWWNGFVLGTFLIPFIVRSYYS